jgi:hypothetical protein
MLLLGLGLTATAGCYNSGNGADPDDKRPYFPVGIALSSSGKWLFVANSNFDLAYNAGTVQAFNADAIVARARACRDAKTVDEIRKTCDDNDPVRFFGASVRIGAFAADLRSIPVRGKDPKLGGRLLLPVRGDASLTAIDYDESGDSITLHCAPGVQPKFGAKCATGWKLGTDAAKTSRGIVLEGEPFGVATSEVLDPAGAPKDTIAAVVHQSSGNVSLFVNVASEGAPPPGKLAFILGNLAAGGTSIAPLDVIPTTEGQVPRFLVTNRSQSNALVVQYFPDPKPERSGLVLSQVIPIQPQASGFDTRGVVVDPSPTPGERPTRVFLTNRTPAALVVGRVDPVTKQLSFYENIALPIGPSRLTRAVIDGKTLILAASFDARSVVIYDPDARRVSNVIRTHRGPYAMVVDSVRKLGFICNFTDSTIQVVELDPARAGQPDYQRIIFSVGQPSGPDR